MKPLAFLLCIIDCTVVALSFSAESERLSIAGIIDMSLQCRPEACLYCVKYYRFSTPFILSGIVCYEIIKNSIMFIIINGTSKDKFCPV